MNENQQLHDDLLNALLPIISRPVYQDIRRLDTLVWAIVGLCLTHTVSLSAWAEVTQSRALYAASRERRFARWLHHPAISPPQWYLPVVQTALANWPAQARLYVATSYDSPHPFCAHSCLAALSWSSNSFGVAGHAPPEHERLSFEAYQPVLDQVCAMMLPGMVITLLADRGFMHERLLHYLRQHKWHGSLALAWQHPGPSQSPACCSHRRSLSPCRPGALLPAGVDFRSWRRASLPGSDSPA